MVVGGGGWGGHSVETRHFLNGLQNERTKQTLERFNVFFFVCLTPNLTYQVGIWVHSCTTASVHNKCDKDIGKEAQQLETAT